MKKFLTILSIVVVVVLLQTVPAIYPIERPLLSMASRLFGMKADDTPPGDDPNGPIVSARALLAERENQELRKQLQFVQRTKVATIGALVGGYAPDPARSSYVIDRGARDGVRLGAPVIAGNGVIIGTVQSVSAGTSVLRMIQDPRSKVLAFIPREKEEGVHGIAAGRFDVAVELSTVPVTEEIRKGDSVLTSGMQDGIPAGLLIGTISDVKKAPEDLFQSASISTPYSAPPPRTVSIIIQPPHE